MIRALEAGCQSGGRQKRAGWKGGSTCWPGLLLSNVKLPWDTMSVIREPGPRAQDGQRPPSYSNYGTVPHCCSRAEPHTVKDSEAFERGYIRI